MDDFENRFDAAMRERRLNDDFWSTLGVEGYEVAQALAIVLAKRLGPSFIDELGQELKDQMARRNETELDDDAQRANAVEHGLFWRDMHASGVMADRS